MQCNMSSMDYFYGGFIHFGRVNHHPKMLEILGNNVPA